MLPSNAPMTKSAEYQLQYILYYEACEMFLRLLDKLAHAVDSGASQAEITYLRSVSNKAWARYERRFDTFLNQ